MKAEVRRGLTRLQTLGERWLYESRDEHGQTADARDPETAHNVREAIAWIEDTIRKDRA